MIINLMTVTEEALKEEAHATTVRDTPILRLHNSGDKNHRWTADDIQAWVEAGFTD